MCIVSTPKVSASDAQAKTPEPTIIRNPYLDGVDPATKALRAGRSSLRIERAGSGAANAAPPVSVAPTSSSALAPIGLPVSQKITPVRGGVGTNGRITRARTAQ